eukprot:gnl/Chilomastix_cuspidata/3041.p3 GENE.gnl/Chilomastix_cuspidata/3041~~gnl/Chilomastix_cuspidata/3041.p3  ORF type:complete len:220 (+),score=74.70 gnl/Chilomastix_cuspidata/3041:27-662(+)
MSFLVILAVAALCACTAPVPARVQGYYLIGSPSSKIQIEMWADYTCSDCMITWFEDIYPLADTFSDDELGVKFAPFSLPYHTASFPTSKAMQAAWNITLEDNLSTEQLLSAHNVLFISQSELYNSAVADVTPDELADAVVSLVAGAQGWGAYAERLAALYADGDVDTAARYVWKTGASRGCYGTPCFFVNGVAFEPDAALSWAAFVAGLLE